MRIMVEIEDGRPVGYLSVFEAADKLHVSTSDIWDLIIKEAIPFLKIGTEYWIPSDVKKPASDFDGWG